MSADIFVSWLSDAVGSRSGWLSKLSTGTTVTCKTTMKIISTAQKVSEKDKCDVVSDNGRRMDAGGLSNWRNVAGSTHLFSIDHYHHPRDDIIIY